MKKILLLLLIGIINLNAYEYVVYENPSSTNMELRFYSDNSGRLFLYRRNSTGQVINRVDENNGYAWTTLNNIKRDVVNFITRNEFANIYKNDLQFLNDLYNYYTQSFLNYLYNDNSFSLTEHIVYSSYELLYNSDGLMVESFVNGVYAGIYSNDEMNKSGNLYDKNGNLVLVNGEDATFLQKLFNKVEKPIINNFMDASGLTPLEIMMKAVIVIMLLIFCVTLSRKAIRGNHGKSNI